MPQPAIVQPTEPPPPDPGPVSPLGCNNSNGSNSNISNTLPAPEASSPALPSLGPRKPHSKRIGFGSPTQHDALARPIVASLLNAQAGLTPGVSTQTIKGIWKEYVTRGYFEPTAGVQWGPQDILTYLASTQNV